MSDAQAQRHLATRYAACELQRARCVPDARVGAEARFPSLSSRGTHETSRGSTRPRRCHGGTGVCRANWGDHHARTGHDHPDGHRHRRSRRWRLAAESAQVAGRGTHHRRTGAATRLVAALSWYPPFARIARFLTRPRRAPRVVIQLERASAGRRRRPFSLLPSTCASQAQLSDRAARSRCSHCLPSPRPHNKSFRSARLSPPRNPRAERPRRQRRQRVARRSPPLT